MCAVRSASLDNPSILIMRHFRRGIHKVGHKTEKWVIISGKGGTIIYEILLEYINGEKHGRILALL
jgi:hypothetical protein